MSSNQRNGEASTSPPLAAPAGTAPLRHHSPRRSYIPVSRSRLVTPRKKMTIKPNQVQSTEDLSESSSVSHEDGRPENENGISNQLKTPGDIVDELSPDELRYILKAATNQDYDVAECLQKYYWLTRGQNEELTFDHISKELMPPLDSEIRDWYPYIANLLNKNTTWTTKDNIISALRDRGTLAWEADFIDQAALISVLLGVVIIRLNKEEEKALQKMYGSFKNAAVFDIWSGPSLDTAGGQKTFIERYEMFQKHTKIFIEEWSKCRSCGNVDMATMQIPGSSSEDSLELFSADAFAQVYELGREWDQLVPIDRMVPRTTRHGEPQNSNGG